MEGLQPRDCSRSSQAFGEADKEMTRGGLYLLSLLQQPPRPPSPTPSYPEEPNGPTGPLRQTHESLESPQQSGMVTSGTLSRVLAARGSFHANCVYVPV